PDDRLREAAVQRPPDRWRRRAPAHRGHGPRIPPDRRALPRPGGGRLPGASVAAGQAPGSDPRAAPPLARLRLRQTLPEEPELMPRDWSIAGNERAVRALQAAV